ncbi:hypothetical protein D9758_009792 [Tetrapyrgos nigripes]|uniref:Uncharacterized protein n=1 Tax=Tetrapyrgos nigripes TaxID=182062 RepID=A0A8H5LR59_9AGAR|nr:hypothetical protein D9758_009792 [Tetrapyrgos nigripes]
MLILFISYVVLQAIVGDDPEVSSISPSALNKIYIISKTANTSFLAVNFCTNLIVPGMIDMVNRSTNIEGIAPTFIIVRIALGMSIEDSDGEPQKSNVATPTTTLGTLSLAEPRNPIQESVGVLDLDLDRQV